MGRINVPPAVGKRQKNLINGKSFGEFGTGIGNLGPDFELKGGSADDKYLVFRLRSDGLSYAVVYDTEGRKIGQFDAGEFVAAYVDEAKKVYVVGEEFLSAFSLDGVISNRVSISYGAIKNAFFANGHLYTIEYANGTGTKEIYATKHDLSGNIVSRTFVTGSNMAASLDLCTWVMGHNDEKVLFKTAGISRMFGFDFKTKKAKQSSLLNFVGWGLEKKMLIGENFVIPEVFKSSQWKIQCFSNPIFSSALNKYIFLAKCFVGKSYPNGFLLVFLIDRDGADDVEVRMLNHSITEGSFTFDPVFLESKRILIFKELARNPQFIAF